MDGLRRQIEEDYRLDIAAIERLQRRFVNSAPTSSFPPANLSPVNGNLESLGSSLTSKMDQPRDPHPDELTGSLRAMFSSPRK
ncbi:MAG TPA: hypothetical protein VG267_02950 [Terracidiphilus sp.]|jgi:hypothetical protein|nr:hypothetical protein [Terracidiphilus sp.]